MIFSQAVFTRRRCAVVLGALLFLAPCFSAQAQADKKSQAKPEESKPAQKTEEKMKLPPLPPDAHVEQTIQLSGKALHYTVTVGTLPVRDADGKEAG
jgi:carboxypeptidase C (cathepsin A)